MSTSIEHASGSPAALDTRLPESDTTREERSSESYWRSVANQPANWGWPETPESARRVIDAAKRIERASQYGISATAAVEEYEAARAAQAGVLAHG